MAFYVLDENNNKVEAYDKEGVLAVLAQAIEDGSLDNITSNSAFISKIKCCVNGVSNNIAFITQAKYNELEAKGELRENTYYYITDDTTAEDINAALEELNAAITAANTSSVKTINVGTNDNALSVGYGNGTLKRLILNANLLINTSERGTITVVHEETTPIAMDPNGIYLVDFAFYQYGGQHIVCLKDRTRTECSFRFYYPGISTTPIDVIVTFEKDDEGVKVSFITPNLNWSTSPSMTIGYTKIGERR